MTLNPVRRFVARLVSGATAFNTINVPTLEMFFQRSPDFPQNDVRGVSGLDFQAVSGGIVIQRGQTGIDGKIDLRVPGGRSTLQLLHNGAVVAEYEITVSAAAFDAVNTIGGQKQRLRELGYQIGHGGPDGNGVDNVQNFEFERSALDFQADQGFLTDAIVNANVQNRLTTRAGG